MPKTVTCKECNFTGPPVWDKKCPHCGVALRDEGGTPFQGGEQMTCTQCENQINEGDNFCTGCGLQVSEAQQPTETPEVPGAPHCTFCGLDVNESEEFCPRCDSPIAEAKDGEDDEDDDEDDEDDAEDNQDGDQGKKILKDKTEGWTPQITPADEARLYIDLASQLDESQIDELAAHIVWGGSEENTKVDPPRWLPQEYGEAWGKALSMGRPKTLLSAISHFNGVVGSRG